MTAAAAHPAAAGALQCRTRPSGSRGEQNRRASVWQLSAQSSASRQAAPPMIEQLIVEVLVIAALILSLT